MSRRIVAIGAMVDASIVVEQTQIRESGTDRGHYKSLVIRAVQQVAGEFLRP
jgi:hypothetical protein